MRYNGKIQLFPLLRIALMLVIGIIAGDALYGLVPLSLWLVATILSLVAMLLLHRHAIVQSTLIMLTIIFLGGCLIVLSKQSKHLTLSSKEQGYEAIIVSSPVVHGKVVMCDIIVTKGTLKGRRVKASILRDYDTDRTKLLHIGSQITCKSVLEKPANYYQSSNFDYERWLYAHGFVARTFIYYKNWKEIDADYSALSLYERARLKAVMFREKLVNHYTDKADSDGNNELSVVAAMTLGDKAGLSKELKDIYSITGASHLLALSGLHLGIIYAVLSSLIIRRRWHVLGHITVVAAIWAYAFLVGMMPSIVRAATMFTLYALVAILNRERMSVNALSFAAIVLLIANPFSLWDVGFQMSFLAVLGIFIFFNPIYKSVKIGKSFYFRPLVWLWSIVVVSVASQLGVAPLIMYYFGRFSCCFILTNIVAVPLATLIIYCALLFFVSIPIAAVHGFIGDCMFMFARWLNDCLSFIASLPGASIDNIRINVWQLTLIYVLIACLYGLTYYAVRMWRTLVANNSNVKTSK